MRNRVFLSCFGLLLMVWGESSQASETRYFEVHLGKANGAFSSNAGDFLQLNGYRFYATTGEKRISVQRVSGTSGLEEQVQFLEVGEEFWLEDYQGTVREIVCKKTPGQRLIKGGLVLQNGKEVGFTSPEGEKVLVWTEDLHLELTPVITEGDVVFRVFLNQELTESVSVGVGETASLVSSEGIVSVHAKEILEHSSKSKRTSPENLYCCLTCDTTTACGCGVELCGEICCTARCC